MKGIKITEAEMIRLVYASTSQMRISVTVLANGVIFLIQNQQTEWAINRIKEWRSEQPTVEASNNPG